MKISNGPNAYKVGKKVGEAKAYRLFLCIHENSGRQCLLQIAVSAQENGKLDRSAYILNQLKAAADELEKDYARTKKNPKSELNYDLHFPELVDSFIYREQGGRRINILAFRSVSEVGRMIPLANITAKDCLRIDLRTSGWIMGKTLKALDLAHSLGIAVNETGGNNILIEKDNHYVVIFDWLDAELFTEAPPSELLTKDIVQSVQSVIEAMGGNWKKKFIPDDEDEPFELYANRRIDYDRKNGIEIKTEEYRKEAFRQYCDLLFRLARGEEKFAYKAHSAFYQLIDTFWPREYYPFTVKPLI